MLSFDFEGVTHTICHEGFYVGGGPILTVYTGEETPCFELSEDLGTLGEGLRAGEYFVSAAPEVSAFAEALLREGIFIERSYRRANGRVGLFWLLEDHYDLEAPADPLGHRRGERVWQAGAERPGKIVRRPRRIPKTNACSLEA